MRLLPATASALILALTASAVAQPAPGERGAWSRGFRPAPASADAQEVEAMILDATNAFRRSQGLPDLTEDARLTQSARAFAQYLAQTGRFSHTADGREPSERAEAAGYDYCEIAENIAWAADSRGFGSARLTDVLMDGWKASPGHRRNMLDRNVSQIGVGVAPAAGARDKYLAVQEFGRPGSERFSFQVVNRTAAPATYTFGDRPVRIAPHTVITHTACTAEPLRLTAAASVRPSAGAVYAVRP